MSIDVPSEHPRPQDTMMHGDIQPYRPNGVVEEAVLTTEQQNNMLYDGIIWVFEAVQRERDKRQERRALVDRLYPNMGKIARFKCHVTHLYSDHQEHYESLVNGPIHGPEMPPSKATKDHWKAFGKEIAHDILATITRRKA